VQTSIIGVKDKVYVMLLEIQLPKKVTADDIKSQMKLLSKELNVYISVNQADSPEI
jgi:glycine cleavage system regulatory protein